MNNRRKLIETISKSPYPSYTLPDGYVACDYVTNGKTTQNVGQKYFDTGFLPSYNYTYKIKYKLLKNPTNASYGWVDIWGIGNVTGGTNYNTRLNANGSTTLGQRMGSGTIKSISYSDYNLTWSDTIDYSYDSPNNKIVINGNEIITNTPSGRLASKTMLVGTAKNGGSSGNSDQVIALTIPNLALYGWEIWNNKTLIQWFVPCYKDGVGYVYDVIADEIKPGVNGSWGYGFD